MSGTPIEDLSPVDSVTDGDSVPINSKVKGDTRRATMLTLKTYVLLGVGFTDGFVTQYSSPSGTGQTTTISPADGTSVWLRLTPNAGYAAHTVTLPPVANYKDKQLILVTTSQAVTTLTIAGNGATVNVGAPTTLAAGAKFTLRYDPLDKSWTCVG